MLHHFRARALTCACLVFASPALLVAQDAPAPVVQSDENIDAGAYLAANAAGMSHDYQEAATWFTRALISDPTNPALLEGSILSNLASGRIESAITVAQQMIRAEGPQSQLAMLALLADQAKRGDFAAIVQAGRDGRQIGLLVDALSNGWSELGTGSMSAAQAAFDSLAKTEGVQVFGLFHKALALASVGDFEGAEAIFAGPAGPSIESLRRGVIAHAQVLSQLERNADAVALLDRVFIAGQDPVIEALRARLVAGEPVPFDIARNATDGLAEVFFTLATGLNGEAEDTHTLLYAQIAAWLRPDHSEAQLLTAGLLERLDQPDLATAAYARILPDDPSYLISEMGRASTLARSDKVDSAIEVLTALTRSHPQIIDVHRQLGDLLRREDKFEAAIAAYDTAIELSGDKITARDWMLFFSRGVAQERQKRWELAEADFRKALELFPDQPQVLNYMGYSMLERKENLEEALSMISKAVAAEPDSGYILDSLAWGYYRLGRYEDAVEPMERASLLEPLDAVVTDHLGDVYWAVGRKLEAQFQWRRALSFDKGEDPDLAPRIRRKLEVGLDAVLAEEGQEPIEAQTAQDGI